MNKKNKSNNNTVFAPTKPQVNYLEAFMTSAKGNKTEMAKEAGVSRKTIYRWRKDPAFVAWFNGEVSKLMKADLPDVWLDVKRRAKRNYNDSKLFLERFDEDYAEKKKVDMTQTGIQKIVVLKDIKDLKKDENDN